MDLETRRACPYCAETIKAAAKLCPRCRQWLTFRSLRNPAVSVWLISVPYAAAFLMMGLAALNRLDRTFNPKPNYTEFLDSLQVLESSLNWAPTKDGLRIYVTGILTNKSQVGWRDIEFDCRFFDTNKVLVDAAHPRAGVTIQANDDTAFRATVTPARPTNDYASYRLTVTTARNTKGAF